MRVLIIGAGYIGLPLGAELARRGHEVSGLRRSWSAAGKLEIAGMERLFADITKPEELAKLSNEFDWVVNCVATSGGDAEEYRRVYLEGMRNVIEWLVPANETHRRDAGTPRILYTSSTSVYGQNDGSVVDEQSPTEPTTETARVLLDTEKLLVAASRERNFQAIILRVAGIHGPERGYRFKQFLKGEALIAGKGDWILNMIHRDDVIGCVIAALEHGRLGNIYNAVDDEPVSQYDFFAWLATTLGKPMPDSVSENAGEMRKRGVTNKKVSNRKLKTELGYRFRYPTFREGYETEIKRLGILPR